MAPDRSSLPYKPLTAMTSDCDAKPETTGEFKSCLVECPVEIILDILSHLDLVSMLNFSLTGKTVNRIFNRNKMMILVKALFKEFSPFDQLLQIYTATAQDIDGRSHYRPRNVIFERFPGDKGYTNGSHPVCKLFNGEPSCSGIRSPDAAMFCTAADGASSGVRVLGDEDLVHVLRMCRLVRQWEELFPQMRWFHNPQYCRLLNNQELLRFRRALYRWWLYGVYFHGEWTRPEVGHPMPFTSDIRISQIRRYSTAELMELLDVHETMKDVILHYICPRFDPASQKSDNCTPLMERFSREFSLRFMRSDQSKWSRIVKTYAKLNPKELMHYFENIYSYTGKRLMAEIRLERPTFTFDQESLQGTIQCVLEERQLTNSLAIFPCDCEGGILDFGDERDEKRAEHGRDGRADGMLPAGASVVRQYSLYSPRGEDGEYLMDEE